MKIDLKRAVEMLTACGYECHEIESLRQQLAELDADVKLLRDAILKRMASENRWPDYIQEALAATEQKP